MKQVLAECKVSCQVTLEDWVLKRAAKVFDANVPAIEIGLWRMYRDSKDFRIVK